MPRIFAFILLLAAVGSLQAATSGSADGNWPQWRGPLATGESPTGNPPLKWSEGEHVKWKVMLPGEGTATPIVWQNQVFIQAAVPVGEAAAPKPAEQPGENARPRRGPGGPGGGKPTQSFQFTLISLERGTGRTLWKKVAREELPHEGHHPDHGFASHSPITDGQNVYAYFGSRGLHCYDLQGNLKWEKDLGRMQTKNSFGEGSSPVLDGDTLVVDWDHEGDDFIAAFDKKSGKELWRTSRDEDTSWATPVVVEHAGKKQVVTSATRKIRSYDLESGKLLWECAGMTRNTIPSPLPGKDMVYATSGFMGSALLAIKLGKTGDLTGSDSIAWSRNKGTPYVPSPLLYQDRIYLFSGNNAVLSCFDANNGQPVIESERIEGLSGVYASPVAAAGRIYLVGRNGASVVLKAGPKLEILATNKLEEKFDASPAIAGNQLFLRGHQNLYCISE